MRIIERYISAYIVDCLLPIQRGDDKHMNYVYEVLRETGSNPEHPILRHVLNFVRQSDPADPKTRKDVRDYVLAMITREAPEPTKPRYKAYHATISGVVSVLVFDEATPVAAALSPEAEWKDCQEQIMKTFPGIVFEER